MTAPDQPQMVRLPYEFEIPESFMRVYWDEMSEQVVAVVDHATLIWSILNSPNEHVHLWQRR